MAIVRWDPLAMMRWPSSIFDEDMTELAPAHNNNLDVYETADSVVIRANVAGIPDDKVDLTFEKGVLWIRGEVHEEQKEERRHFMRSSWSYSYKIAVPGNIDLKKEPQATVDHGVITVTFNKLEEEKPRKITINKK